MRVRSLPVATDSPPAIECSVDSRLCSLHRVAGVVNGGLTGDGLDGPVQTALLSPQRPSLFVRGHTIRLVMLCLIISP